MTDHQTKNYVTITVLDKWAGTSVQDLFRTIFQAPKKLVHELRMEKSVLINHASIPWTSPLSSGDVIEIALPADRPSVKDFTGRDIDILFEDEHLLIANKPAGMQTHPNDLNERDTLANAIAFHIKERGGIESAHHVHRLDKDTTGAVIFAKHALSLAVLSNMLQGRKIERTYWALADGIIQKSQLIINEPIGRDRHHPTRRRVSKTGQKAMTRIDVIQKFPREQLTLIKCMLETGRTHQIRVHASYIGYPLAGDQLYGGRPIFSRQALHAREIAFIHPFTLEKIECIAPFQDDPAIFESLLSDRAR